MIRWPKIFAMGDVNVKNIFDDEVEITEKLDGSQFNFSNQTKDGMQYLTKGSFVTPGDNNKLFAPVVYHLETVKDKMLPDWTYHGETLARPGHNTLVYDRVPKNHLALYGVTRPDGSQVSKHEELKEFADALDVEVVPLIARGKFDGHMIFEQIKEWLKLDSVLGSAKIEGIVVKNYYKQEWIGGRLFPLMQAKHVSEAFKEMHQVSWPQNNKGPMEIIGETVRTEARFLKAVQKLKELDKYTGTPRDIGELMKILHTDIEEEDSHVMKNLLWTHFSKDIKKMATRGFPEWYKEYIIKDNFGTKENEGA